MNIYIDFDGTLFDTEKFYVYFFNRYNVGLIKYMPIKVSLAIYNDFIDLCKKYNVSESNVFNLRNKTPKLFNLDDLALEIKEKYNLDDNYIKEVNLLYNKKYLYSDVMEFLEKYHQKYNLYILSFGETKYQNKKINCCHFKKYFKDIIITTNKGDLNIDYVNSWFIDNNPKEIEKLHNAGANKIIRIKRKDDPHFSLICSVKVKDFFALDAIDVL